MFTGPGTRTIPISIVNDNIMEDLEFFTISLSNPQPDGVNLGISSIIINIIDDGNDIDNGSIYDISMTT